MKKIILLITFTTLLFGCSNSGNTSSTNNGNSFTNSMDYEFTITINGEVHKIKGNTTNGIPTGSGNSSLNYINNQCLVGNYASTQKLLMLIINDVTASNFISGQNLECQIILPNLLLGVNQAQVNFRGSYFDLLCTSLGAYSVGGSLGISDFQTVSGVSNSTFKKLPINITDLGTISSNPNPGTMYNFGETVKGNYSGTIYLQNTTNYNFTIPVQLSIDFKALRYY